MDDFGTGYSSLSYLWKFPFDKIKIDRSFMEGFEQSGRDVEAVIRSIIALGRELNMRVTVEGVESARQVSFLYDAHADQVQGFFFGRPESAADAAADIRRHLEAAAQPAKEDAARQGENRRS
jgi:EAL domain-containing protein (putative c-di-GMP-specific phosphodiesterase class I)